MNRYLHTKDFELNKEEIAIAAYLVAALFTGIIAGGMIYLKIFGWNL